MTLSIGRDLPRFTAIDGHDACELVLARAGRTDEARDLLAILESLGRARYVPPAAFALVHAGFGDREAVFEWLDKAAAVRDVHLMFLPVDSKWDEYRGDSRFDAILARCGFTSARRNAPV